LKILIEIYLLSKNYNAMNRKNFILKRLRELTMMLALIAAFAAIPAKGFAQICELPATERT